MYLPAQVSSTINRVIESLRPHQDVVVIHIGSQEILDAAHGCTDELSLGSLATSVATVISRHVITAANQHRETQFLLSLPLPRNLDDPALAETYAELRKAFNANMKANCTSGNVQCCDNENLALDGTKGIEPDSRYFTDSIHLR